MALWAAAKACCHGGCRLPMMLWYVHAPAAPSPLPSLQPSPLCACARACRDPSTLMRLLGGSPSNGALQMGDLVTRAHHAYALMVTLQLGIR